MKKNLLFLLIFSFIISCTKDEIVEQETIDVSNIKVYVDEGDFVDKSTEIVFGDTIDGIRNVFTILYAEENGKPINVFWEINYQNPFLDIIEKTNYYGDQISHKFEDLGFYQIKISLNPNFDNNIINEFYLFIDGIPGKLGDGPENDFIFRIEKKNNESSLYWLVFFKYASQVSNSYVELTRYNNQYDILSFDIINLNQWFSDNYHYFILSEELAANAAIVRLVYKFDDNLIDPNLYLSSWFTGEGIEFSVSFDDYDPLPFTCGDDIIFYYGDQVVTYGTVVGEDGRCWLDRNLGANRVCLSIDDQECFGDYFQWGRLIDGHQLYNSLVTDEQSTSNIPGHPMFISHFSDWRNPKNDNLWQGENGVNNPCPPGWRVPTLDEVISYHQSIEMGVPYNQYAFDSNLKFPSNYARNNEGEINDGFVYSTIWTSTVNGDKVHDFMWHEAQPAPHTLPRLRVEGRAVRCILD